MTDDVAWMQIYGQTYWHMPAKICGNRIALTVLRNALDKALEGKKVETIMFSSDGEGYDLSIQLVSQDELEALPCHYTHPVGRTQWDNGYQYASDQLMPMIRSLQERLRKLEGKPLKKDKLMEAARR